MNLVNQNGETCPKYGGHQDKELSISVPQSLLPDFQYSVAGCLSFLMPWLLNLHLSNCRVGRSKPFWGQALVRPSL